MNCNEPSSTGGLSVDENRSHELTVINFDSKHNNQQQKTMGEAKESDSTKYFDYYEITGILAPGALFLFGMSRIFHESSFHLQTKDMTVGDFGLFAILSYAAGHLIQIAGNILERVWWFIWGGYPSSWVRSKKPFLRKIISLEQKTELVTKIKELLGKGIDFNEIKRSDWHSRFRQIYGLVAKAKLSQRADSFNRTYGMLRGMTVVLLLIAATLFWKQGYAIDHTQKLLLIASAASLLRMHLFGRDYAREVLVQFLNVKPEDLIPSKKET
jgi:hypothetical protein